MWREDVAAKFVTQNTENAMTTNMLKTEFLALALGVMLLGALATSACKISKQGSGEDEKVSVAAPGASVKVDTGASAIDSGIPLYPGAQEKHGGGDDKNRAHVDLNMPFLKVKVVALKFTSDDAPEKILAFYRGKLGSYGAVVECNGGRGDVELGSGRGMNSPVTCDKGKGKGDEISLKVGTESEQHVVSVKPSGKGSEFELVYVRVGTGKNDDDYGGKQPS
jgi:hypothetical protein